MGTFAGPDDQLILAAARPVWRNSARLRASAPRNSTARMASVVGMLVTIAGGSAILRGLGHGDVVVALVAMAVGLHFFPFASAFCAPVFPILGSVLAGIGLGGVVIGWFAPIVAVVAAVAAGLSMLAIMIVDTFGDRRRGLGRDLPAG
jgi:hypothetical protein